MGPGWSTFANICFLLCILGSVHPHVCLGDPEDTAEDALWPGPPRCVSCPVLAGAGLHSQVCTPPVGGCGLSPPRTSSHTAPVSFTLQSPYNLDPMGLHVSMYHSKCVSCRTNCLAKDLPQTANMQCGTAVEVSGRGESLPGYTASLFSLCPGAEAKARTSEPDERGSHHGLLVPNYVN